MGTLYAASMMQEFRRRFQRRRDFVAAQRARLLKEAEMVELTVIHFEGDREDPIFNHSVEYSEDAGEHISVSDNYSEQNDSSSGSRHSVFV